MNEKPRGEQWCDEVRHTVNARDLCRKHTSASFRLIVLITCVELRVLTLLLLLCVINKKSYGMKALESINWLKGKLNEERTGQGTGTNLVRLGQCH